MNAARASFVRRTTRQGVRRDARQTFDSLEPRRLLAAASEPVADRIDAHLLSAVEAHARRDAVLPANIDRRARFDSKDKVETYIRVSGKIDSMLPALKKAGVEVVASNDQMHVVQGWIPSDGLTRVASLAGVTHVEIPDYAVSNVTTAGDTALNADKVRQRFAVDGIDGTGVKIGVISDGANHRANVAAELPSVTVNPSIPGNGDEGTAMLEIVHDLAPGAQLYFSGPNTSVQMVNSINYLVNQGCKVIVDDLGFLGEAYFTDSAVAQAALNAVNSGVVYVTSAGNFGNAQHYQAQYFAGLSAFDGGVLHRFGAAGQDTNQVNIAPGAQFRAFLEWSDPWGTSSNNYDLYLYDGDTIDQLDSSKTVQNGNDLPFEMVTYTNNTNKTIHAQLWVNRKTGAASRELELFTIGNSTMQFSTQGDALFGHEAVPEVMSVAAASAASPSSIEAFSSRGGSTVYSNFATQTKAPMRASLDGTAIDGVQTAVGQAGFFYNPFYGTSAAAPHAATIAALVRQANPSLTPAQVVAAMANTAVDLGAAGYDTSSGAGRYDALNAVYSVYTPAAPDLATASDSGTSSTDNLTKDNTPTFTGTVPLGSQVKLYIDGVSNSIASLALNSGAYTITTSALPEGTHTATIQVAPPAGFATVGSLISTTLTFTIDTTAPTLSVPMAFNYDDPQQNLTATFSESVISSVDVNAVILAGPNGAVGKAVGFAGNKMTVTFPGQPNNNALPNGNYTATFAAGAPADAAGNVATIAPFNFFSLAGDANRDGKVDFTDLVTLAQNYNSTAKKFSQGNFDYDAAGDVNFTDLVILAQNYNVSLPGPITLATPTLGGKEKPTRELPPLLA